MFFDKSKEYHAFVVSPSSRGEGFTQLIFRGELRTAFKNIAIIFKGSQIDHDYTFIVLYFSPFRLRIIHCQYFHKVSPSNSSN